MGKWRNLMDHGSTDDLPPAEAEKPPERVAEVVIEPEPEPAPPPKPKMNRPAKKK